MTDPYAYRELSPAYSYTAAAGNLFGVPAGDSGLAAADGYWLMLSPLSPGVHEIRFGGGISSFGFSTLVTSRVTAVPEPASLALCGVMALVGLGYAGVRRRVARVA